MSLEDIRKEIDIVDNQIKALLKKRFNLAKKALKFKDKIYDRKREKDIFSNIEEKEIKDIFKSILKNTKKILNKIYKK